MNLKTNIYFIAHIRNNVSKLVAMQRKLSYERKLLALIIASSYTWRLAFKGGYDMSNILSLKTGGPQQQRNQTVDNFQIVGLSMYGILINYE